MIKKTIVTDEKIKASGTFELDEENRCFVFEDDKNGSESISFDEIKKLFNTYECSFSINKKAEGELEV